MSMKYFASVCKSERKIDDTKGGWWWWGWWQLKSICAPDASSNSHLGSGLVKICCFSTIIVIYCNILSIYVNIIFPGTKKEHFIEQYVY